MRTAEVHLFDQMEKSSESFPKRTAAKVGHAPSLHRGPCCGINEMTQVLSVPGTGHAWNLWEFHGVLFNLIHLYAIDFYSLQLFTGDITSNNHCQQETRTLGYIQSTTTNSWAVSLLKFNSILIPGVANGCPTFLDII